MLQQAFDFRDESDALFGLLETLNEAGWAAETQFKKWTPKAVVTHLHMGNYAADLSLQGGDAFAAFVRSLAKPGEKEARQVDAVRTESGASENRDRLIKWRDFYREMAERFAAAEPKRRVKWFGPDMSVLSSISARLMETWAHGQAVYDFCGKTRAETVRLKNIAV